VSELYWHFGPEEPLHLHFNSGSRDRPLSRSGPQGDEALMVHDVPSLMFLLEAHLPVEPWKSPLHAL
jgi:hypothetical protein